MGPKHHGEGKRDELREDITEAREWKNKMEEAKREGHHKKAKEFREKYEEARKKHYADAGKLDEYYEIRRTEGDMNKDRNQIREDHGKPNQERADHQVKREDEHRLEREEGRGGHGGGRGGHRGGHHGGE